MNLWGWMCESVNTQEALLLRVASRHMSNLPISWWIKKKTQNIFFSNLWRKTYHVLNVRAAAAENDAPTVRHDSLLKSLNQFTECEGRVLLPGVGKWGTSRRVLSPVDLRCKPDATSFIHLSLCGYDWCSFFLTSFLINSVDGAHLQPTVWSVGTQTALKPTTVERGVLISAVLISKPPWERNSAWTFWGLSCSAINIRFYITACLYWADSAPRKKHWVQRFDWSWIIPWLGVLRICESPACEWIPVPVH